MSALKNTFCPATGAAGETVKSADGAAGKPTDTVCEVDAETPRSLVTVSVTTNVPEDVTTTHVFTSSGTSLATKLHAYETRVLAAEHAPLGAVAQAVEDRESHVVGHCERLGEE